MQKSLRPRGQSVREKWPCWGVVLPFLGGAELLSDSCTARDASVRPYSNSKKTFRSPTRNVKNLPDAHGRWRRLKDENSTASSVNPPCLLEITSGKDTASSSGKFWRRGPAIP
ncbi:hypothetical protein BDW42DRAFT_121584 [Aspergillus taichungensis]|uniref:Uncharacterized protein n=1 Tax=Aspergillus taichungensis TaxID=482145 RepID=A0A2J5I7L1_9EURO|nr:hypothetical protein BDW42DRAFT_121584 [Aspergillus taichungensis]